MSFGNSQADFSKLALVGNIASKFAAIPKPNIKKMEEKGKWVNEWMKKAKSKFVVESDHLIYSDFNLTNQQWISQLTSILDELKVSYTHESLKSGQYTNEAFIISKQYALNICALRRGGRGILLVDTTHLEYMRNQDKETRARKTARDEVVQSLTLEQRKALGV